MIAKVTRGDDAGGLVRYLLGDGRANEHVDQRVIATSPGIEVPLGEPLGDRDRLQLVDQLDTPRAIYGGGPAKGYVYHLSLSNPAEDRVLDDAEWAEIVTETMSELGFTGDDVASAPWAAFRHGTGTNGNDHVHVAVTMVREDGGRVKPVYDLRTLSRTCHRMEQRYGLTVVEGRTAGAAVKVTRAELEIAGRTETEPTRLMLARTVRAAAAASADEAEFVRRLRSGGVMVAPRYAAGDDSRVTGFSVAVRPEPGGPGGDAASVADGGLEDGGPVGEGPAGPRGQVVRGPHPDSHAVKNPKGERRWFAAGKLGRDLSLPALRAGWAPVEDQAAAWSTSSKPGRERARVKPEVWRNAAARARSVTDALADVDPADTQRWAQAARDASGVYAQLAARLEPDRPGDCAAMSEVLARSAAIADHRTPRASALDGIATVAAQVGTMVGKGGKGGWLLVGMELGRLVEAISRAHAARGELQRAQQLVTACRGVVVPPTAARTAERTQGAAPAPIMPRRPKRASAEAAPSTAPPETDRGFDR